VGAPEYPDDDVMLYKDESVSIWHCRFQPDLLIPPHDHQTMATIGVYKGVEINRFYVRESGKLTHESTRRVVTGDVIAIGPDAIHTVQSDRGQSSCAIHVHIAALTSIDRSLFDWDTGEPCAFTDDNYERLSKTVSHDSTC